MKTSLSALACALTIFAPAMAQNTNWTPTDTITTSNGQMRSKMDNAMPRLGYVSWGTVAA